MWSGTFNSTELVNRHNWKLLATLMNHTEQWLVKPTAYKITTWSYHTQQLMQSRQTLMHMSYTDTQKYYCINTFYTTDDAGKNCKGGNSNYGNAAEALNSFHELLSNVTRLRINGYNCTTADTVIDTNTTSMILHIFTQNHISQLYVVRCKNVITNKNYSYIFCVTGPIIPDSAWSSCSRLC